MKALGIFGLALVAVLVIGSIILAAIASTKKKKAVVDAQFIDSGLHLDRDPDQLQKDAVWPAFAAFSQLKYGSKKIAWIATGELEGRSVIAIKHSYTVSTGQSTATIVHLCFACRCPMHWPLVELKPENVIHRIAEALGKNDLELESPVFNRRWRVTTNHADHGLLLLTPEIQAMLEHAPKGESWAIGDGWVRLSVRGKATRPQFIRDHLLAPGRLLDMVPQELFVDLAPPPGGHAAGSRAT